MLLQIQRQWLAAVALLTFIAMMGIVSGDHTRRTSLRSMHNNEQTTTATTRRTATSVTDDDDDGAGRIRSILDYGAIPDSVAFGGDDVNSPLWSFREFEADEDTEDYSQRKQNSQQKHTNKMMQLISSLSSLQYMSEVAANNTVAFNTAIDEAEPGDTVLVPDGHSFTLIGGLVANEKQSIVIDFAGSSHFAYDRSIWPFNMAPRSISYKNNGTGSYDPGLTIYNSTNITVTSSSETLAHVTVDYDKNMVYLVNSAVNRGGIINGYGKQWWDDAISGRLPDKQGDSRPRLVHVMESEDIHIEKITLLNSPFWTLTVEAVRAEINNVNVLVDRRYQSAILSSGFEQEQQLSSSQLSVATERSLLSEANERVEDDETLDIPFPIDDLPDWVGRKLRQPEDLNTDGIDPIGQDIWIHHCIVQNADDSIAVKPSKHRNITNTRMPDCTRNVTIEHTVLTGFGASIGSVGPSPKHNCVDNVTFHNISMPGTGKGIYIKSDGSDCLRENETAQITNIMYDEVHMYNPFWWPIWVGPQQQHEPNVGLGLKCPLTYPLPGSTRCPTQGCVTFENITLRNIYIHNPVISPGVILGNSSNPMTNFNMENVQVHVSSHKPWNGKWPFHEKKYPWHGKIKCHHAEGTCHNCHPAPRCLAQV